MYHNTSKSSKKLKTFSQCKIMLLDSFFLCMQIRSWIFLQIMTCRLSFQFKIDPLSNDGDDMEKGVNSCMVYFPQFFSFVALILICQCKVLPEVLEFLRLSDECGIKNRVDGQKAILSCKFCFPFSQICLLGCVCVLGGAYQHIYHGDQLSTGT